MDKSEDSEGEGSTQNEIPEQEESTKVRILDERGNSICKLSHKIS